MGLPVDAPAPEDVSMGVLDAPRHAPITPAVNCEAIVQL